MLKPDRIEIIERHPEAEQPYNIIKETYVSYQITNGVSKKIEKSNLVSKNIRPEGHKVGLQLTEKQREAKRIADLVEEQKHSADLLAKADQTGNSDDGKQPEITADNVLPLPPGVTTSTGKIVPPTKQLFPGGPKPSGDNKSPGPNK